MDIQRLLSPQENNDPPSSSPAARPATSSSAANNVKRKAISQAARANSNTSIASVVSSDSLSPRQPTASPSRNTSVSSVGSSRGHPLKQQSPSPLRPAPAQHGSPSRHVQAPTSNPQWSQNLAQNQQRNVHTSRNNSATPGMDALANVATIAQAQQVVGERIQAPVQIYDTRELPETPDMTAIPALQKRESQDDAAALQAVQYRARRTSTVPHDQIERITSLLSQLSENPYAYRSHVELITVLHQSFLTYCSTPTHNGDGSSAEPGVIPDFASFPMLDDLRMARRNMSDRFAVGERLWMDWISDERTLATSLEHYVRLVELCRRSIDEEPRSSQLWWHYTDLLRSLCEACANPADTSLPWTPEEKQVGRETFSAQRVLETWSQAADQCKYDLQAGNVLWDAYVELVLQSLAQAPDRPKIDQMRDYFVRRLQTPHRTWDQTFQAFSSFVSTYYRPAEYESLMSTTNASASVGKNKYSARQRHEIAVAAADQSGDRDAQWIAWNAYANWEANLPKKFFDIDLCCSVYERALLKLGYDSEIWEDYVYMLLDKADRGPRALSVLPILSRATRHCPWSGSLWAQYLLSAERARAPYNEVEGIKHRATHMGVLDMGGIDEVLKVYTSWCGILVRKALSAQADDEDQDIADVGIRTAIESMRELGERKYGRGFVADPTFRLERLYIQYLSRVGLDDSARRAWEKMEQTWGSKSYNFWFRWYRWEMVNWGKTLDKPQEGQVQKGYRTPAYPTAVLRRAVMKAPNLDEPEKVFVHYLDHCEDYEDADEVQDANKLVRKQKKILQQMRQREAESTAKKAALQAQAEAASAATRAKNGELQAAQELAPEEVIVEPRSPNKRKRESHDEQAQAADHGKRTRGNGHKQPTQDPNGRPQRDRENNTVSVNNLPPEATELQVRRYFQQCGTVNSIKLASEGESQTATIEFAAYDDVLAALTKNMKYFDDKGAREWQMKVSTLHKTTVWVTNFPETADEAWLRNLFSQCGEIVELRLPSLKYDARRRFCYVQYQDVDAAQKACDMLSGKTLTVDGSSSWTQLIVKFSDPSIREERKGAVYEGRELFVKNIDWSASQDELKELFSKFGTIEKVRIPKNPDGKSKGFGYVAFEAVDAAQKGLEMDGRKFRSRILTVTIADANPKNKKVSKGTTWTAPETRASRQTSEAASTEQPQTPNGAPDEEDAMDLDNLSPSSKLREHSDPSILPADSSTSAPQKATHAEIEARTIALLSLPDTLSAPQLHATLTSSPYQLPAPKKITLVPVHGGATVEFEDAATAGRAMMVLDGAEIGDVKVHAGAESLIKSGVAVVKDASGRSGKKGGKGVMVPASVVRRPGVGGKRGGGKLGSRTHAVDRTVDGGNAGGASGEKKVKSNKDFKAFFASASTATAGDVADGAADGPAEAEKTVAG